MNVKVLKAIVNQEANPLADDYGIELVLHGATKTKNLVVKMSGWKFDHMTNTLHLTANYKDAKKE